MADTFAGPAGVTSEAPLASPYWYESPEINSADADAIIDYYAPCDLELRPVAMEVIVTIPKGAASNTVRLGTSEDDDGYFLVKTVPADAVLGTRYNSVNGGLEEGVRLTAISQKSFSGSVPMRITTSRGGMGSYKVRVLLIATGPASSVLFKGTTH